MPNPELLAYLSDNGSPLAADLEYWLQSKRWEAFATVYRDKIRKKLRETREPAALGDLRAELETAYLLLAEPRLSVVYEPFGRGRGPAPDYAVQYTTSLTVMLEVTRLRDLDRLGDVVAAKLRQLTPDHPNVLLVWLAEASTALPDRPEASTALPDRPEASTALPDRPEASTALPDRPGAPAAEPDLRAAMLRLKQRAEQGEQMLFDRARFAGRADFIAHLGRLSELLVRRPALGAALKTWSNPTAKRRLPGRVRAALTRVLEAKD